MLVLSYFIILVVGGLGDGSYDGDVGIYRFGVFIILFGIFGGGFCYGGFL